MTERPHRLFVAVPLPPDAVEACTSLIERVRSGPAGRAPRWVHVPNLHLTVRFLGDTPPERVADVAEAVRQGVTAGHATAFDVRLAGAGAFPASRRPRALWLGIEHGSEELGALARSLDRVLEPLGWAPETRPYRPHLTIARLDAASRDDGEAVLDSLERAAAGWSTGFVADRVVLFRSRLGGGPPRHDPVAEVRLAEAR